MLSIKTVLFPATTCQDVYCEKGQLIPYLIADTSNFMQHTNCVLYVLITHCHKYTAVVVNMQEILFVLQEIMQYSACGHVSLECYRVLQHTQKSKHICNFLFRLWLSVTDSLTRHTSHHMRPLFPTAKMLFKHTTGVHSRLHLPPRLLLLIS